MSDTYDDAELIVETAAVVARAELECISNEVIVGLGNAIVGLTEFSGALANAAERMKPLVAALKQRQAEEAADLAAWDDEMPF